MSGIGIRIHGSINLQGTDAEVHNLELEELIVDPINPKVGKVWYNTTLERISYAELVDNVIYIRRVANDKDVAPLRTTVVNNTTNNLLFGQPVYEVSDSSVDAASANDINKRNVIGFVSDTTILGNGGAGQIALLGKITGTIQQWGFVTDNVNGLVPNAKYFLDINAGKLTTTMPSGNGVHCCVVGTALTATDFIIKIERPITL